MPSPARLRGDGGQQASARTFAPLTLSGVIPEMPAAVRDSPPWNAEASTRRKPA